VEVLATAILLRELQQPWPPPLSLPGTLLCSTLASPGLPPAAAAGSCPPVSCFSQHSNPPCFVSPLATPDARPYPPPLAPSASSHAAKPRLPLSPAAAPTMQASARTSTSGQGRAQGLLWFPFLFTARASLPHDQTSSFRRRAFRPTPAPSPYQLSSAPITPLLFIVQCRSTALSVPGAPWPCIGSRGSRASSRTRPHQPSLCRLDSRAQSLTTSVGTSASTQARCPSSLPLESLDACSGHLRSSSVP
jgi:hypothetical protein